MKNLHLKILAITLATLGLSLCFYKVVSLGLPLTPTETEAVWNVEAKISFQARGKSSKVSFHLPDNPPDMVVIDENFVSGSYGLAIADDASGRQAQWAVRRASGQQALYYRVVLNAQPGANLPRTKPRPDYPKVPEYGEPLGSAVMAILDDVREESADTMSFTRSLINRLLDKDDEDASLIRELAHDNPVEWARTVIHVLAGARIPARLTYGLSLKDGLRHGNLEPWLEIWDDEGWHPLNPSTGKTGYPKEFLLWRTGDDPLVRVSGGTPATVDFSAARSVIDMVQLAEKRARLKDSSVMEFSLFSLPLQTQNVYRILLMVPLGALVVVFLRNMIGIKSFGTFMPILMALAFRETGLFWGVILVVLMVAMGLLLRFYLERLKLLLVPRLTSVLIIVVILMLMVSLISHKLGLDLGLSIALFPMVILTMTIERMSLVWEEKGPKESFMQGMGSLFMAAIGFLAMNQPNLEHLLFVFPELLLVILSISLLMGRYSGYRLTEYWRFREVLKNPA